MSMLFSCRLLFLLLAPAVVTAAAARSNNKTALILTEQDGALSHALGLELANLCLRTEAESRTVRMLTAVDDGFCANGIITFHEKAKHKLCCAASCGKCADEGCGSLPGGAEQCCVETIFGSGKECGGPDDTGCLVPSKNAEVVPETVSHPYPFPYSVSSLSAWDGPPMDGVRPATTNIVKSASTFTAPHFHICSRELFNNLTFEFVESSPASTIPMTTCGPTK